MLAQKGKVIKTRSINIDSGFFVDSTIQHPNKMYAYDVYMYTYFHYTKVTHDLKSMIFDVCLLSVRTKPINPEHSFLKFLIIIFSMRFETYKSLSGYIQSTSGFE